MAMTPQTEVLAAAANAKDAEFLDLELIIKTPDGRTHTLFVSKTEGEAAKIEFVGDNAKLLRRLGMIADIVLRDNKSGLI